MTKGATAAWMKFYVSDWTGGVRGLSLAAKGAYIDLLCLAWEKGSLPDDHAFLARYLGVPMDEFQAVWKELDGNWTSVGGVLTNPKQEEVRAGQEEVHRQRVEAGRRSAAAKRARAEEQTPNVRTNVRTNERANVRTNVRANGEREDSGLRAQVSRTEEQQASGARPREAAAAAPSEGDPDWVAEALAFLRKCGVPVEDSDQTARDCLATARWGPDSGLSKPDRLRALTALAVRSKTGANPVGLLKSLLVNKDAAGFLESAPPASSKWEAGSGQRDWSPGDDVKAKAHRGEAASLRDRASKGTCSEADRGELLSLAADHDAEAEKLEAVA